MREIGVGVVCFIFFRNNIRPVNKKRNNIRMIKSSRKIKAKASFKPCKSASELYNV
jgi:hypothetical protein